MKFTTVLACLLVLAAAAEVKLESAKSFQVSPDQDVAESYRGGFYGGYRGYWRGRRSVEGKPENEANDDVEVDRETKDEVEINRETKDEVEVDRNTKDEVEIDREAKDEVDVEREAKDEVGDVGVDQEAKDEVEVDQEANEYRRGYYGGYRAFGRGRRSAEELKNAADQEANEFRRSYYGGYHGYRRGRRSAEEMNVPVYSDQDVSEWYARRYYGRPYTY